MLARNLINELILNEVRVRKPMDLYDFQRMLKNLYRKTHGENPAKEFISTRFSAESGRQEIKLPLDKLLPGMEALGFKLLTSEFEAKYLRNTGWRVDSALHNPTSKKYAGVVSFQSRVNPLENKPEFLYHAASTEYEESILKKGLLPKTRPKDDFYRYREQRIFLTSKLNFKLLKRLISDFEEVYNFSVFRIDTKKFKKFNVHVDDTTDTSSSDFPFSVYTLTHIPPSAIELTHRYTNGEVVKV